MPPTALTRKPTLGVDLEQWERLTATAGLVTEASQAAAIGVSRGHLNRVRNGHLAPGPEFIARVRIAFPKADVLALFPVVNRATA